MVSLVHESTKDRSRKLLFLAISLYIARLIAEENSDKSPKQC